MLNSSFSNESESNVEIAQPGYFNFFFKFIFSLVTAGLSKTEISITNHNTITV